MDRGMVNRFKEAVDTFTSGKYILFDKKLEGLLNAVADSKDVYNLIAKCLKSFDFETEKNAATSSRTGFRMPAKSEKVIALAFCILSDIDEKKIDFYKFLTSYFAKDDINASFNEFNKTVVLPFKNTVAAILESHEEELARMAYVEEEETKEKPIPEEIQKIMDGIDELIEISNLKEKSKNPSVILLAMKNAALTEEAELYQALKIAFFKSVENKKFLKYAKMMLSQVEN